MIEPERAIRLIAIDIDGTLLNQKGEISPRTKAAIQAAQQAGIVVTLATGRRHRGSRIIAQAVNIQAPLITYDGGLITQRVEENILATNHLSASVAQQTVDIFVRHGIQPVVQHVINQGEISWSGPEEFDSQETSNYLHINSDYKRLPYAELCTGKPDPLRVVGFSSEEHILEMMPEIARLDCRWDLLPKGNYDCSELSVLNPTCSKGTGIQTLANHLHIPLSAVMAIGDNTNDVTMLDAVGWGVAMGQAKDEIKAHARIITSSNAEDGVAEAIERYALLSESLEEANSLNR